MLLPILIYALIFIVMIIIIIGVVLFFITMPGMAMEKLKEFATTLKRPYCLSTEGLEISEWFGSNCDENSIKSQAIMAIKNGDEVFGILALGSNNPNRFFPQMGTIYLERMSEMLAASLVRTVFSK